MYCFDTDGPALHHIEGMFEIMIYHLFYKKKCPLDQTWGILDNFDKFMRQIMNEYLFSHCDFIPWFE